MRIKNGGGKAMSQPNKRRLSGAIMLKADNYASNDISVSLYVASESAEVLKVKELAIAQTLRAVFERSLLLKLKNKGII